MTTNDLLSKMTPFTLASLICDLTQSDNDAAVDLEMAKLARKILDANVGSQEAEELLAKIDSIGY